MKKKNRILLVLAVIVGSQLLQAQSTSLLRNVRLMLPEKSNMQVNWVLPPLDNDTVAYSLSEMNHLPFAVDSTGWPLLAINNRQLLLPRKQLSYRLSQPFRDLAITTNGALFFTTENDWGFADFNAKPETELGLPLVPFQPVASLPLAGSRMQKGTNNSLYFFGKNHNTGLNEVYLLQPQPTTTGSSLSGFRKVFEAAQPVTAVTGNGLLTWVALGQSLLLVNNKDTSVTHHPARFLSPILQLLLSEEAGLFYVTALGVGHLGAQEGKDFFLCSNPFTADLQQNILYILLHRNLGVLSISHQEEWKQRPASFEKVVPAPVKGLSLKQLRIYESASPDSVGKPSARVFQGSQVRYLNFNLELSNLQPGSRHLHTLQVSLVAPDGEMLRNVSFLADFKPGMPVFKHHLAFGRQTPGSFCNGLYRLDILADGSPLASDSFRITGTVTTLLAAVSCKDTIAAAALLQQGADPNTTVSEDSVTMLQIAVYNGSETMVQLLLRHGAWPDLQDRNGQNSLFYWRFAPHQTNILKLLLDKGAPVNHKDKEGNTVLSILADQLRYYPVEYQRHFFSAMELLHSRGANLNLVNNSGNTILTSLAEQNATELKNENMLPLAEWLLQHGADPNLTDSNGLSPLQKVINNSLHPQWVRLLLKHGAKVNYRKTLPGDDNSGLISLTFHRYEQLKKDNPERANDALTIARLLLSAGAPLNRNDEQLLLTNGFWQWLTNQELESLLGRRSDLWEAAVKLPHPAIHTWFCQYELRFAQQLLDSAKSEADFKAALSKSRNALLFLRRTFTTYTLPFVPAPVPARYATDTGFSNKSCYIGITSNLLNNYSILVQEVNDDSPLKGLLHPMDIMISLNGTELTKEQSLTTIKDHMQPGRSSSMVVLREGVVQIPKAYLLNGILELRVGSYFAGKAALQKYLLLLPAGPAADEQRSQIQNMLEQYKPKSQ